MRKVDLIVIHCSATRCNRPFSPEQLEASHLQRGFRTCGYHFYITRDGEIHPMRPVCEVGAHALHYNAHSIGICYEGGLDESGRPKDTRTEEQRAMMYLLVMQLKKKFRIQRVVGHRDLSPDVDGDGVIRPSEWLKQCPCFDVGAEY